MGKIFGFLQSMDVAIDRTAQNFEGKKVKLYTDIVGPIVFIIFALAVLFLMPEQIKLTEESKINARTFPVILMGMILFFSVLLLIKEIIKIITKKNVNVKEIEVLTEIKALIILVLLIIFLVLMNFIGFLLASMIFSVLMLYFFRIKNWKYYIIILIAAVLISLLFQYGLKVRLP